MTWTTLELAKKHVGIPLSEVAIDDRLRGMLETAEAIVIAYLQTSPTPTPPDPIVREAIHLQFAELWAHRGDDAEGVVPKSRIAGAPSVQVERCLFPHRPPSLA